MTETTKYEQEETMTAILLYEDAEYYECFHIITGLPDDMDMIKQITKHIIDVHNSYIDRSDYIAKIVKINKTDVMNEQQNACCETIWRLEEQYIDKRMEISKNFIHMEYVEYWSIKSYMDHYFSFLNPILDPVINARNALKEFIKQTA